MNDGGRAGRDPGGAGAVLGVRLLRYAGVQGSSMLLSNLIQVASLAVVANFLGPGDLGRYALLLFLAGIVTIVFSILSKPGTLRRTFGGGDDDDDDDDEETSTVSDSPQRSLGIGLLWAFMLGLFGAGLLFVFAAPVADLLLGTRDDANLVKWAGAAVAFGTPFRLASITIWLERRPTAFLVVDASRPLLTLIAMVVLLAAGAGVEGAIAATAIGSAAAMLVALFLLRNSAEPGFDLREMGRIVWLGRHRAPIVMSFWTIQNADIFLLSRFVSEADLGIYALASRLGFVVSFLPQGFRVALRPLRKSAVFQAVKDEYGLPTQRGQLLGYFTLLCIFAVLAMVLLGEIVVEIAPPEYADAAPLIPFTAAAMVMPAFYRTVNANVAIPYKRVFFISGCLAAAAIFAGVTIGLSPEIGIYAAPIGIFAGFATPATAMFAVSQLGSRPIKFPYRQVLVALLLACAIAALFVVMPKTENKFIDGPLALIALGGFLIGLVVLRVIPRNHWTPLLHMARSTVRGTTVRKLNPRAGLRSLERDERKALRRAVKRRLPAEELRDGSGEELVATLRKVGTRAGVPDIAKATKYDAEIAVFLFERAPTAVRNASMRKLLSAEASSTDLRALEDLVGHLVRVPNEAWKGKKPEE